MSEVEPLRFGIGGLLAGSDRRPLIWSMGNADEIIRRFSVEHIVRIREAVLATFDGFAAIM